MINIKDLGKKYNRRWIFNHLSIDFELNNQYAILGSNGSGKSTLLKLISGQTEPDSGTIQYKNSIDISYTAPYIHIPEEFTLIELLEFHSKFKKLKENYTIKDVINICSLDDFQNRQIKQYSSGMKQRVKLSLSFFFKNDIVLFDEPCSHLDENGIKWYQKYLSDMEDCIVIIGSNQTNEYKNSTLTINIEDYKN